ncbi:MAG: hypothetical protein ACD_17C00482G0004, partial [uncultured bacterium]
VHLVCNVRSIASVRKVALVDGRGGGMVFKILLISKYTPAIATDPFRLPHLPGLLA